jgi:hypothetical protein
VVAGSPDTLKCTAPVPPSFPFSGFIVAEFQELDGTVTQAVAKTATVINEPV